MMSQLSIDPSFVWVALVSGGVALALSLVLPFPLRRSLERWGVIDIPNERSSHERPVLRGMGLAVLIAMMVGGALSCVLYSLTARTFHDLPNLLAVLLGALAASLVGLKEDLGGLSVKVRSLAILAIALAVSVFLLWGTGEQRAGIPLPVKLLIVIYAVLFISSFINVANFMDGLNGISGFHGVIAGLTFFVSGMLSEVAWLETAGLILAAGFAGFLPWNLSKPGAFLGDVGSYLLGGAIAITSLGALITGVPMLATIGPMIIYFGDVGVTLTRRVRSGKKWYEPHKEHVFQKINQLGYTHLQASGITAGFTLAASLLGLLQFWFDAWWPLLLLAGVLVLVLYLATPRILPRRHTN